MTVSVRGGVPLEQTPASDAANQDEEQQQGDEENSGTSQEKLTDDSEEQEVLVDENGEPIFPTDELTKLDEMISRPKWVVPVLPKCELEVLLEASIKLCRAGLDTKSEPCQKFFREGLSQSFQKILNDEAVHSWKYEIQKCIYDCTSLLIELCVSKLPHDWFVLLDLLALVFNPHCRFHIFNAAKASTPIQTTQGVETEVFANPRTSKGWLIDFVNHFGVLGGFKLVHDRICEEGSLSVSLLAALIKPFGNCAQVLSSTTVEKYFLPVIERVQKFLVNLTNEELKKESKNESKNDSLSSIVKTLKSLAAKLPKGEDIAKDLETFRLKMIFRLLQVSSFNGKMNALNEINKVISSVSYYSQRHMDDDEWLTADKMAEWIHENDVLSIVLKDNLHQPQYVEKLEKIIRFVIKEKALTLKDLDNIWSAQAGKHEVIVKNIHDLLAKLAWDFSAEQLDHLFECFQESWTKATKKQREKLLELIRRLAEDDKEGVMAHKVLGLLWNLAHKDDVPTDIMDQALNAHIKILDYSCSQDRDSQKTQWITKCVEELRNDTWVLPAIKQIREICCLFYEAPQNYSHTQRNPHVYYRHEVINDLQNQHHLVPVMAANLKKYTTKVKRMDLDKSADPNELQPDGRYSHVQQVQKRLSFLRFLLKDGQLWLCGPQANMIWEALAENPVFASDREACFKWFSKLMGEEQDLDPEISREFFEGHVLHLEQTCLTENGMECFERFFQKVNVKERKFVIKRRSYVMDDLDLIGIDYLWEIALKGSERIVGRAVNLLKQSYTNLGPRLRANQVEIHEKIIQKCIHHLMPSSEVLQREASEKENKNNSGTIREAALRIVRCLTVLKEYIAECDDDYGEERLILPHGRAYYGKHITLIVRTVAQGRQSEDFELWSHLNETIATVRRHILQRMRHMSPQVSKVDLYIGGDLLSPVDDKRLLGKCNFPERVIITAKVGHVNSSMPSSPDSSSDSSSSPPAAFDGPNIETERCLPGVIISERTKYVSYFLRLANYGVTFNVPELREEVWSLLDKIPTDASMADNIRKACSYKQEKEIKPDLALLQSCFNPQSVGQTVYNLEILYSLLMPAGQLIREKAPDFQVSFLKCGGVQCILDLLTKSNFLETADTWTKRSAYLSMLKIIKFLLTTVAYAKVYLVAEALRPAGSPHSSEIASETHNAAVTLQQALQCIPHPVSECVLRNYALSLGHHCSEEAYIHEPSMEVVKAIQKLSWTAAGGMMNLLHSPQEEIHKAFEKIDVTNTLLEPDDVDTCKEAVEVLTLCLAICPKHLETLSKDRSWQSFITDLVLLCNHSSVRWYVVEQFFLMSTRCSSGQRPLIFLITLLFSVLTTIVEDNPENSGEYFTLLSRLLSFAHGINAPYSTAEKLLANEIAWLKKAKDIIKTSGDNETVPGGLLGGHLLITRELLSFLSSTKKHQIGCHPTGPNLVKELMEEFIFPASKLVLESKKFGDVWDKPVIAVCNTSPTLVAAFELLVALCAGSIENLQYVTNVLTELYYSGNEMALLEWEYTPPIGPRPVRGFVGLKNAGATCYMNSVIQQLFMIPKVREGILGVEETLSLEDEESLNEDEKAESESTVDTGYQSEDCKDNSEKEKDKEKEAKKNLKYQMNILKQLQFIFGHLIESQLQFHVPQGLWKTFKYQGEPVNLREQHDALEFFNSLIDNLDEGLKALGHDPLLIRVLGGTFADQKICKGCPHRYSKDDPFIALTIDIRNHQNLIESLDQFVKGDLLEGANAYHCDKCNKKVDTVKRMCFKKLPQVLAIQLKRFDYDWERDVAVKFNDYFEFPREFDMEPYTVDGLARLESKTTDDGDDSDENQENQGEDNNSKGEDNNSKGEDNNSKGEDVSTTYRLAGVVVHSGQASGGHYYSYIRTTAHGCTSWFKFDDGDVSDCKMDDDEEMKTQCFGGEYMGEVFDHMMKRMSYRRQKRWWNAYILFYERTDASENYGSFERPREFKMPCPIEQEVRKQNVEFLHNKIQFSTEYFDFIRKLVTVNINTESEDSEDLSLISITLLSKFLFSSGLRTKKTIRGPAGDWYDALTGLLRQNKTIRLWFAQNVLFAHPERISEYLLESPTTEVRTIFAKILIFLCHVSKGDGDCDPPYVLEEKETSKGDSKMVLSEYILRAVLKLLQVEVPENGRHLHQYFSFFWMYAGLGNVEKKQLLSLEVPALFIQVALDEGPGLPIRYQYPELGKLHAVVSYLIRACDVSSRWQSSVEEGSPIANKEPEPIMKIQENVEEQIFGRTNYIKKLIEDHTATEETILLLKHCCWEVPHFSWVVLKELLWQVSCSYTYEMRPFLDLLLEMLLINDSWQKHRIVNVLKGAEGKEGLFDTILRSKSHYHKRAYQCIKFLVSLFTSCPMAHQIVLETPDFKSKWTSSVEWLNDELDRRPYGTSNAYTYNNWSPPAQSNETSNGVFLERSQSARLTLAKACEFIPEEEQDETEVEEVTESEVTTAEETSSDRPSPSSIGVNQSLSSVSGHSNTTQPLSTDQSLEEGEDEPSLEETEKAVEELCLKNPKET